MAKRRWDDRGGERARPAAEARGEADARAAATELAVLELSGELGYEEVTVAALVERAGVNRAWFYATYGGKAECYARAYGTAAEALRSRLLDACVGAPDPASGLRAGLAELGRFLTAEPAVAAGVLAEVWVAGGAVLAKRNEVFERLSRAIDTARRELPRSRHSPPPTTATFILDAIEAAVIRALREGGDLEELTDALARLVLAYYPVRALPETD